MSFCPNDINKLLSKDDIVAATALYRRICSHLEYEYLAIAYPHADSKPILKISMEICDSRLVNDSIMKQIKTLLSADGWKNIELQKFEHNSFFVTLSIPNIDIRE